MATVGVALFVVSTITLVLSGLASLFGVLALAPGWKETADATGDRFLRIAPVVTGILAVVGFLGTAVGLVGLVFAGLWSASPLIASKSEAKAAAVGLGRVSRWPFISVALWVQAASGLLLGLLLAAAFLAGFMNGARLDDGANALYAALFAQYSVSMLAVGVSSALAARGMVRTSRSEAAAARLTRGST